MNQEALTPCIIGRVYRGSIHEHPELQINQRLAHLVFTIGTSARYSRFFLLDSLTPTIDEYPTATKGHLVFREHLYAVTESDRVFIGYAQSSNWIIHPFSKASNLTNLEEQYRAQDLKGLTLILVKNFKDFVT